MLALPETGVRYSATKHNSDLDTFCDWIEASVIFSDESISQSDEVDCLMEAQIYNSQDLASAFVETAWAILRRRFKLVGAPLGILHNGRSIVRTHEWHEFPAYGFCVLLSCLSYLFPKKAESLERDIQMQGDLFEQICEESFKARFASWTIRRVGWAPSNPVKLYECVDSIIEELCEIQGAEKSLYVDTNANELGLDIILYSRFMDSRPGFPVLMVQCASGKDWTQKRKTPDLSIWRKIVNFNSVPVKAFAMPYAFADELEFRKQSMPVEGVFFDRYRLLTPRGADFSWASSPMNQRIIDWCDRYVTALPTFLSAL